MRFIGRQRELEFLEQWYDNPTLNALALIGRRRIGKTTLIRKFLENKPSLHIQFLNSSSELNLIALENFMSEHLDHACRFRNYLDFFTELKELARKQRTVFVFDEYPYICEAEPSFSSILQNFIDHDLSDSLVILSGSSITMMDEEISERSRPLFGRVHPFRLDEMTMVECREFYPEMSTEDQLRTYLTFGGIPLYYTVPGFTTYCDLVEETVLKDNSVFHEEGDNIINRELTPAINYYMILDAISSGSDEISSMSAVTGLDRQMCTSCLNRLVELKLVSPIHPMAGMKTKPVIYRITDRMLSFHHFVQRRMFSSQGDFETCRTHIYTLHGRTFEDQCARYLLERLDVIEIGKWIGPVAKKDSTGQVMKNDSGKTIYESADIDIVATVQENGHRYELFCECKFTGETVGFTEYNRLMERVRSTRSGPDRRLAFFSRFGFDERFEEFARMNGILLVSLEDLLE
ncbi:MAG: ATP-binding protein [archaeon]|nr:ATP-binding protein [archaeon]